MPTNLIAVDFRLFPDNHVLPARFTFASHQFESIDINKNPFVNDTAGDRGLQFSDRGLRIGLPHRVDGLQLCAGGFATPVTVKAIDAAGTEVWKQTLLPTNKYIHVDVTAQGIVALELVDGAGEGILLELTTPC